MSTPAPSGPPTLDVPGLMIALEKLYTEQGCGDDFPDEKGLYAVLLRKLAAELLKARFALGTPINVGSTATVWNVTDISLGQPRALKLSRPRLAKLKDIVRIVRSEPRELAALVHQNIIKVYTAGEIDLGANEGVDQTARDRYVFPYFIMEHLGSDVKDFDKYIYGHLRTLGGLQIVEYFRDALTGISVLHANKIIHCDIKPGNLLIAKDRPALVTDLGYAKHLPRASTDVQHTEVKYTPDFAHPDLKRKMKQSTDPKANVAELERTALDPKFDLFAFGRTMQRVLSGVGEKEREAPDPHNEPVFTPYQWRYLELISKRLLDGQIERPGSSDLLGDIYPGFGDRDMTDLRYRSAGEALVDFEKLLSLHDLEGHVPELNPHLSQYIQIPHGRVPLTRRVREVIDHPAFSRLSQISQLGFVSTVYPGANHTRCEHVLGSFANCCNYIRALWYDESNCLFQCIMKKRDLEVALLAALVHDLGQYPMAHDLAEVAAEFAHERFTRPVVEARFADADETLAQVIEGEWGIDIESVIDVLRADEASTLKQRLLHSLISGPVDCDKLDYLRRDSAHLGVMFGLRVDYERLLRNLTCVLGTEQDETTGRTVIRLRFAEIGIAEKALVVASSVVQARSEMFKQVYWQHSVRAMKAMLGFAVRRTLELIEGTEGASAFWKRFQEQVLYPMASVPPGTTCVEVLDVDDQRGLLGEDVAALLIGGGSKPSTWPASSHLYPTDDLLLRLIQAFGGPSEKGILGALQSQRLYKRIAVLPAASDDGSQENGERYARVYNRIRTYRVDGPRSEIEKARRTWESRLRRMLLDQLKERPEKLPAGKTQEEFKRELESVDPLILVDIPIKATGKGGTGQGGLLRFVTEETTGLHPKRKQLSFTKIRAARIDLDQERFDRDVGKIRVLAHPDYRDLFVDLLDPKTVLTVLDE